MITPQKTAYIQPGDLQTTWLIARRQFLDAIRDRSTLIMACFFLLLQTVLVLFSLGSLLRGRLSAQNMQYAGTMMSFYLLYAGIMPSTPAISIAAGVFAGDKERGRESAPTDFGGNRAFGFPPTHFRESFRQLFVGHVGSLQFRFDESSGAVN